MFMETPSLDLIWADGKRVAINKGLFPVVVKTRKNLKNATPVVYVVNGTFD
jgi:hypothetical protein